MKETLFSFEGRSGRKTWWLTVLAWTGIALLAQGIAVGSAFVSDSLATIAMILAALVGLAGLVSVLAVSVRRWHDVDKSGWWVLIALVPVVGIYALIMNGFVKGTPEGNRFGTEPVPSLPQEVSQPA